MEKLAPVDHQIHHLLRGRWSPRAFANRAVEPEKLQSIFEAARWSPSAGNSQPWAFIVATHANRQAHDVFVKTMTGRNPSWAKAAPVLVLAVAKVRPQADSDQANPWGPYDLGQAVAHLSVEASALGLYVHQMAGFDQQMARDLLRIPSDFAPFAMIAIGYYGDLNDLSEELRIREISERQRKPQSEFVFGGEWGTAI